MLTLLFINVFILDPSKINIDLALLQVKNTGVRK